MKYNFLKIFVILILLSSSNPQNAFAHAQLVKEFPLVNSEIVNIPEKVSLDFDNQIIDLGSGNDLQVINENGVEVSTGNVVIVGANISRPLSNTVEPGKYKVIYRVVSEDGHIVTGEYFFSIIEPVKNNPTNNEASRTESAPKNKPDKSEASSNPEAEESKADAVAQSGEKSSSASENHKEHDKDTGFFTHHRTHIIWTLLVLIALAMIGYYRRFRDKK